MQKLKDSAEIDYSKASGPALRLRKLSVTLDERSLITTPDLTIMPARRYWSQVNWVRARALWCAS